MSGELVPRQSLPATPLDGRVVGALRWRRCRDRGTLHDDDLRRRARHDVRCAAGSECDGLRPCKDGISHHPAEEARPEDAALAAEIILNAIAATVG